MRNPRAGSLTSMLRTAVLGCAVLAPPSLSSQQPPLAPGDRVRVTTPIAERPLVATVERLGRDSLELRGADTGAFTVPLASLTRLEVSRGTRGHTAHGAVLGFVTFALLGYVIGSSIDCGSDCPPAQGGAIAAGIAAVPGALIGAAVGSSVRSERWRVVSLRHLGPGVAAWRDGRVSFAASVRF